MDHRPADAAGASDPVEAAFLSRDRGVLRFLTCGAVDSGKSTLIGRLMYEAGRVPDDHMAALHRDSRRFGTTGSEPDLALLVDGLEDERRQGITIDVAYRSFSTARRSFVIADAPGHEDYTRNMATAASTSDLAILLVDAGAGLLPHTRRHAHVASLFGIRSIVLAINKIDLAAYDEALVDRIVSEFRAWSGPLGFASVVAIPISARHGDNVVGRSARTPWFTGPTMLEHLETVRIGEDAAVRPLRFPVQWVGRSDAGDRTYAGTVASGTVRVGQTVAVAGRVGAARIAAIRGPAGEVEEAGAGEAVALTMAEPIDLGRGDVLHPPDQPPPVADQFAARILWIGDEPLLAGRRYVMRIGMRFVPATVTAIRDEIDVGTLSHLAVGSLARNAVALCNVATDEPVAADPFRDDPGTGSFILVDRYDAATVGAGTIDFALMRAGTIHEQRVTVDRAARTRLTRQRPVIVWFTGLSGSGKSTIADLVEQRLHADGHLTYLLDGDNVRRRLNRDLGFTDADRVENIRRAGEVARLFVDAGLIVLCAFISPFAAERQAVRELVGPGEFVEVFVDTPIDVCIARDPKRLYAGAGRGEVRHVTGLDSRYEPPQAPELHLRTIDVSPGQLAQRVVEFLKPRILGPDVERSS